MGNRVLQFTLSKRIALEVIREAARNNILIIWLGHAQTRMRQKKFTDLQVIRCLERGSLTKAPSWDDGFREWRCRLQDVSAGQAIEVVVAIEPPANTGNEITVITVI